MDANPTKIAVHHRYPILRDCLSHELSRHFNEEIFALPCVPKCSTQIMQAVDQAKPHLLLLDLDAFRAGQSAATSSAVALLKAIHATDFATKVVVLSECQSFSFINAVLCAWASAYLVATCLTMNELVAGCEAVQAGALFLCAQSKRILSAAHSRSATLTTREVEIVRLLAAHPNDQYQHLAGLLHVTSGTMRTHLANLRMKLGVQSNHEMIDAVRTLGFIE
jgi:DNA-binding NarL/FixJ family response regulator